MTIETTSFCTIVTANKSNVFRSKTSGDILTNKIYLGCNDTIDNYEEISEEETCIVAEKDEGEV